MGLTRIAEYEIERELGTGAMGTVYLARRGTERFALKVIRPELVDTSDAVARFRREADLGGRVHHRNVVRTLGSGVAKVDGAELHYLVMEYVRGKDLRTILEELGTVPEALLREIASQIAAGLEAIHEAGVVHRDLKPENVLVTEANEVRIMDLGVARLTEGTTALTREGDFTGTLLYAAPEQFLEAEAGPASDLYALGVVLYELATGANPFFRSTSLAVMQAHAEFVPVPVCERQPSVSPFLSELTGTLLAKRADRRFPSASDVRRTLEEAESSPWWRQHAPLEARHPFRRPRLPVERAATMQGRRLQLETLRQAFADALHGEGSLVLVEGEAGIGKTRLLAEFVESLGAGGYHVLYGAFESSGGLRGVTDAIVDHLGEDDLAGRLEPHLPGYGGLVPAYAARLREQSPPPGSAPLPTDAMPTLTCRFLQSLADDAPVVWIVDDVHLAREEGVRLLTAVARAAEHRRILVIAASHVGGLPDAEREVLERLEGFRRVALERLAAPDVVRLLAEALHSEPLAETLGGRIATESDGVPLFVLELVRALSEGGVLRRLPDGAHVQARHLTSFSVPATVRGLVTVRLKGLADEDREILDVAAVQGGEFDAGVVARVLDLKPVQVLRRLAVMERRTGMVRASGARYRFDQKQIQETLYEELPLELRQEYHALLADDLEQAQGTGSDERDGYVRVLHHLKGARPRAALLGLDPALKFLERASLRDEFFDLAETALARPGLLEGGARAEVLYRLSVELARQSGLGEALPVLAQALDLAEAAGDATLKARARFFESRLSAMAGKMTEAYEGFARARDLAHEAGDGELEARATGSMGVVLDNTGRHREGLPLIEHHLADARRRGDRNSEMIAACNLGLLLLHLGRRDDARVQMELHLRIAKELGDVRSEAVACGNLAMLEAAQGRLDLASELYERNILLANQTGSRGSAATASANLGYDYLAMGRVDRALQLLEQSRVLAHEMGDVTTEASAERTLGAAWTKVGRFEEALDRYERALTLVRRAGDRHGEAGTWLERGSVLSSLGRRDDARTSIETARRIAHELDLPTQEAAAILDLARLERAVGSVDAAERLAKEALARIEGVNATVLRADLALLRAALPGGDVADAERAFLAAAADVPMPGRADRYRRLWELTHAQPHLETARSLLDAWEKNLSPALRAGLEDRVPSFRAIRAGVATGD